MSKRVEWDVEVGEKWLNLCELVVKNGGIFDE